MAYFANPSKTISGILSSDFLPPAPVDSSQLAQGTVSRRNVFGNKQVREILGQTVSAIAQGILSGKTTVEDGQKIIGRYEQRVAVAGTRFKAWATQTKMNIVYLKDCCKVAGIVSDIRASGRAGDSNGVDFGLEQLGKVVDDIKLQDAAALSVALKPILQDAFTKVCREWLVIADRAVLQIDQRMIDQTSGSHANSLEIAGDVIRRAARITHQPIGDVLELRLVRNRKIVELVRSFLRSAAA